MLIILLINTHSLVSKGRRLDAQLKKWFASRKWPRKHKNMFGLITLHFRGLLGIAFWRRGGGWGGTN